MKGRTKRRVVALLTNYPSDHLTFGGGIETATAALLEGLHRYEDVFEFHIVSTSKGIARDVTERMNGVSFHFLSIPRYWWTGAKFPLVAFKTYRKILGINPDLIHCQGNVVLASAATIAKKPCLFTIHGIVRDEVWHRKGWEFMSACSDALIERYVRRRCRGFICISSYARRVVGNAGPTFCIPNAVRSVFFGGPELLEPPEWPNLVFIGVFAPLKRPEDLILAHARLRKEFQHLEVSFCGGVENRSYGKDICKMISERGIEGIRFMGPVRQEGLVDLLRRATALVVPSAQENSPMVIGEAMAVGVPVVATRVGGIPDMVHHGETGLLYEPGDVNGLVSCLTKILSDSSLWKSMSGRARRIASCRYSPDRVARDTVEVYERMLSETYG
jgi:glycosyltransferase involved in cell wall biosynthesis